MPTEQLPCWIQYISALGPTAVAASVAYVAWNQWKTAHAKLRFDLFDRRYKVYRAIQKVINLAAVEGQLVPGDLYRFYDEISGAAFLFNDDVRKEAEAIGDRYFEPR